MSATRGRWRWIVAGSVGFVALLIAGGLWLLSSDWLREKVRSAIVSSAAVATGGRVELEGFRYDWRALTAEASRFVIHGSEPAGAAPLLETGPVKVRLQIISLLALQVRPTDLEIVSPKVHVIVQPDGSTNLPRPKTTGSGGKSVPETIVDLKISRFTMRDGQFIVDAPGRPKQSLPLDMRGEGLRALFTFEDLKDRYAGELALGQLAWNGMSFQFSTQAVMERNRVWLKDALVKSKASEVRLAEMTVDNLADPTVTAKWEAKVTAGDWVSQVKGVLQGNGLARYHSATDYDVTGSVQGAGLTVQQFRNVYIAAQMAVKPDLIQLSRLHANALGGDFLGEASVKEFKTLALKGKASHFRLAQVLAALGNKPLPYDAVVSGPVEASGPFDRLRANAELTVEPVKGMMPVRGIVAVKYDAAGNRVDLGQSFIELPHSRVDVSGTLGATLDVKASSSDLADLAPLLGPNPPKLKYGSATFTGQVTGPLKNPQIRGSARAEKVVVNDVELDSLAGELTASAQQISVARVLVAYGSAQVRVDGKVGLVEWKTQPGSPVTASVTAGQLDVEKLLGMAGRKDIPVTGVLNGALQITGTVGDPKIAGDVAVGKGAAYGQPFDSVTAHVQLAGTDVEAVTGLVVSVRRE